MLTLYAEVWIYVAAAVFFNVASRASLSKTRYEYAYTILWQLACAVGAILFIPIDGFAVSLKPQTLLLLGISVAAWALVDAFLFSAYKHEEASVLAGVLPLSSVFTFIVTVGFFGAPIHPTLVVGFIVIVAASVLVGVNRSSLRPSKGVGFGVLTAVFSGVALGTNSEVVKNFSVAAYTLAAFLLPAAVNGFIFLRPKLSEVRYELAAHWKVIAMNAAVIDIGYFSLQKAFQRGHVALIVSIAASSTLLTALTAIVVLKERGNLAVKLAGAAMATAGVILVQQ